MKQYTSLNSYRSFTRSLQGAAWLSAFTLATLPALRADDAGWLGGNGDWGNASNWTTNSVPTSNDSIFLNTDSGTQAQINGDRTVAAINFNDLTPTAKNWVINSGSQASSLTVTGALTHTSTKSFNLYSLSSGSLDFSADSISMTGTGGSTILGGGGGGNINNTLGTITIGSLDASAGNNIRILASSVSLGDVSLTNGSALSIYNNASAGSGGATVNSLSGSSDATLAASAVTTTSTATLTINSTSNATFQGLLTNNTAGTGGSLAIVKTGSARQSLTRANFYSGGTVISEGTLLISNTSGSALGSGAVLVESGASLGGSGIVRLVDTNSTTVNSGGAITPGGDGGIATIKFNGQNSSAPSLVMESGARFTFDLSSDNSSDQVSMWYYSAGDLVLNDTAMDFTGAQEGEYTLFTFYSDDGSSITTSGLSSGLDLDGSTGLSGFDASLTYGPNSITLTLVSIPEPSVFAMVAGVLVLSCVALRRRRAACVR